MRQGSRKSMPKPWSSRPNNDMKRRQRHIEKLYACHHDIEVPSLHHRCTITVPSLHRHHCTLPPPESFPWAARQERLLAELQALAPLPSHHWTVTGSSPVLDVCEQGDAACIKPSLHHHCTITTQTPIIGCRVKLSCFVLNHHCTFTAPSLHHHCALQGGWALF